MVPSARAGIGLRLADAVDIPIVNGRPRRSAFQGRPIGAPVFQMGPFVMNSAEEIQQALLDYRLTEFGGWPWPNREPVHHRTSPFRPPRRRPVERDRPIRVEEPAG